MFCAEVVREPAGEPAAVGLHGSTIRPGQRRRARAGSRPPPRQAAARVRTPDALLAELRHCRAG